MKEESEFQAALTKKSSLNMPCIFEILSHRDIVHPGLKSRIKELQPVISHMEDHGFTQEEMLVTEGSSNSSEIEEEPARGMCQSILVCTEH